MATRTRNVYPTREIPHLWAHQTQQAARNQGGNFYFDGPTIYSYGSHFPIATHITHKGKAAILVTTRSYSVTTSKQIHLVRSSIPDDVPKFYVYNIATHITPVANLDNQLVYFKSTVVDARKALSEAKNKPQRAKAYRSLQYTIYKANAFCKFFGSSVRYKLPVNHAELEQLASVYEESIQARRDKKDETARIQRERRAAEFAAKMPELVDRWRKGEYISESYQFPTILRIKEDIVETSKGANFPLEHARRVLPIVKRLLARGEAYQRNGHTIHLGHYPLDEITPAGTVYAGCHAVSKGEVERLIREVELLDRTTEASEKRKV